MTDWLGDWRGKLAAGIPFETQREAGSEGAALPLLPEFLRERRPTADKKNAGGDGVRNAGTRAVRNAA